MVNLLIVESPAKSKTIGKYLGDKFNILASFGHMRGIPSKKNAVRPGENFAIDYEMTEQGAKHSDKLITAAKSSEKIYLATDPDREGEAIAWHVNEILKEKGALSGDKEVVRVVFNEITKKAVKYAVDNPKDIDLDLVNAQVARQSLDYLVGFNLSPVLWKKLPGSRSAGRVQSVALRLVCDREDAIDKFQKQEYWSIEANIGVKEGSFSAHVSQYGGKKLKKLDIGNEDEAKEIVDASRKLDFQVNSVEKKEVLRNPVPPFITSTMQQESVRKLGFTTKKAMMIAQNLYEGLDINKETVGLITYMRTDSYNLAEEAVKSIRGFISSKYGSNYLPSKVRSYSKKVKNAQEAHEAIRPTDVTRTPEMLRSYLTDDQYKLYKLIWMRVVASQMASAILDQVSVDVGSVNHKNNEVIFHAAGSVVKFDGFLCLYREGRDDEEDASGGLLPKMSESEKCNVSDVKPNQHFTQPPPRYTEASLVKNMEELGIGRPSTYASIISVIQDRGYATLTKKRFMPEIRGRIVVAFLVSFFPRYVQYDFTAHMEEELDQVSSGDRDYLILLSEFWNGFDENVTAVSNETVQSILDGIDSKISHFIFTKDENGEIDRNCPECKGNIGVKLGKFGPFLGCSGYPDCKYIRRIGEGGSDDPAKEGDLEGSEYPKFIGYDEETESDVNLRKGPYGFYLQLDKRDGDSKEKKKRSSIPMGVDMSSIDLKTALKILSMPYVIGEHPDDGKEIKAGAGKYGPYVLHDGKFCSLGKNDDILNITVKRAVGLIEAKKKKVVKKK